LDEDRLWFSYYNENNFIVDRAGTTVLAFWPERCAPAEIAPWVRGPILGYVLRLRGVTSLHGSAVSVGNHAVALAGSAGSGKSTTAAALVRRGFPALSDDILALRESSGAFYVQPGYPNLCLWPESVKALYGAEDALPRIAPGEEKRNLDLAENGYSFATEPLPLAAVYILNERSQSAEAPWIEPVHGSNGVVALLSNTYGAWLSDRSMRIRDFQLLSRVAAQVPIRRVTPHADPAYLSRLCDVILGDAAALVNQ
jgi:hypothetical protein